MSLIRTSLTSILISLAIAWVASPAYAGQDVVLPRLIVVMDSTTTATQSATGLQIQSPLSSKSLKEISQVAGVNLNYGKQLWTQGHLVNLPVNASPAQVAEVSARIKALPGVKAVTQDRVLKLAAAPNDPYYTNKPAFPGDPFENQYIATNGQWWLKKPQVLDVGVDTAGGNLGAINAEAGWAITTGSNNVVVAVVDTGVRQLPEIRDRLLPGFDFVSANPFQNDPTFSKDGDGWDADPTDPGDFGTPEEIKALHYESQCVESTWHGSFIIGQIAAATNNSLGISGLDWNARVLPVRALGKCGRGSLSDILSAMRWAAGLAINGVPTNNNPAKIINLSLGSGTCSSAEQQVVSELVGLGVTIVVATGNKSSSPAAPADCKGVITVGANSRDGSKVRYSSYGAYTTLMAPGGSDTDPIYSTVNAGTTVPDSSDADSYRAEIGTSFSAPFVTGTVALMLAVNPNLKPGQIKALLEQSAATFPTTTKQVSTICNSPKSDPDELGDTTKTGACLCTKALCGAGILDVETTLQAITGNQPPVLATLPTLHVKSTDTVSFKVTATDAENDAVSLSSDGLPTGATFDASSGQFNWANPAAGTYFVQFYGADLGREARSKEVAIIYVTAASTTTTTTTTNAPTTTTSSSSGGGGSIGWVDLLLLIGLVAGAGCVKILINAYTGKGYH